MEIKYDVQLTLHGEKADFWIESSGGVRLYSIHIADRYQSNNSRRPRNLACYMGTPLMSAHFSVGKAIEQINKLGIPDDWLRKAFTDMGWSSEVPGTERNLSFF